MNFFTFTVCCIGVPEKSVDPDQKSHFAGSELGQHCLHNTQILCIGTDRSQQTVQTKIRLLLKKQSDQVLRWLPFHPHLLDALMQCYVKLFYF